MEETSSNMALNVDQGAYTIANKQCGCIQGSRVRDTRGGKGSIFLGYASMAHVVFWLLNTVSMTRVSIQMTTLVRQIST